MRNNFVMSIKRLLKDVFERIDFLDEKLENPFLNFENQTNPFAKFYSGRYIWVDPLDD